MSKIIGIDQGCTKMLMVAEWEGAYIEKVVPTGMGVRPEYLKEQIDQFVAGLPFKPEGMGMAVSGLVQDNALKISHQRNMEGTPASFFDREGCKTYFINDVKSAMVCEEQHYDPQTPFVLIMAGSGFAMSIRTQGVNVLGKNGWAGELGSNPYPINGSVEPLDDISGGLGILEKAGCDVETLLKAIDNEEKFALDVIEQAGFYFGLALSDIIHTFNPEYIVVGGSCTKYKGYMEKAIATAKAYTLEGMFDICQIVAPKDLKRIVALGAMRHARQQMDQEQ